MNNQIRFGISRKEDGRMGVLRTDDAQHISNRRRFASLGLGVDPSKIATANLTQGCKAAIVSEKDCGSVISDTDALITQTPGVGLRIFTQDCVPIFFHDLEKTIVGIIHAGWRGLKTGIIENTFALNQELGVSAQNLKISTGPAIGQCCFEIDGEEADYFLSRHPSCTARNNGKTYLSLQSVINDKLLLHNVIPDNIFINPDCTFCAKDYSGYKYFSWRRDRQIGATHASIITILPRSRI
ncbi:laccase domain-containing protein [Patescibacteria group bacterium]|nr:MAG: laccase domain-containing protein [Patescibacteria group bacterium]